MFIKRNHNTPVGEVHYDWGCGIETVIFLSINKFLSAIEEAVNNNEFFGYDVFDNTRLEKKAAKLVAKLEKKLA